MAVGGVQVPVMGEESERFVFVVSFVLSATPQTGGNGQGI